MKFVAQTRPEIKAKVDAATRVIVARTCLVSRCDGIVERALALYRGGTGRERAGKEQLAFLVLLLHPTWWKASIPFAFAFLEISSCSITLWQDSWLVGASCSGFLRRQTCGLTSREPLGGKRGRAEHPGRCEHRSHRPGCSARGVCERCSHVFWRLHEQRFQGRSDASGCV